MSLHTYKVNTEFLTICFEQSWKYTKTHQIDNKKFKLLSENLK